MRHDPEDLPRAAALRAPAWLLAVALFGVGCASTEAPPQQPSPEPATEPEPAPDPAPEPAVTEDDLQPERPVRYTVREGDTLWDIAAKFLRDPWVWPEIWTVNPQITNPHLIYPGDVITLIWVDDEPRLMVEPGVRRLEPEIRRLPLEEAIPSIPADAIRSFLNRPRVVTPEEMDAAPYILASRDDRVLMSEGDEVFARGLDEEDFGYYMVFRLGDPLIDPDTDETLGWEAIHTGDARVLEHGDPARILIASSEQEIREGDRLLPIDDFVPPARYIPQVPEQDVDGRIIGLFDAISQVATNQIVVINRGTDDGMEIGTVLGIDQGGGRVRDPYSDSPGEWVDLPSERIGNLMIFRAFDRVSYALIMSAIRPVRMHDSVGRP